MKPICSCLGTLILVWLGTACVARRVMGEDAIPAKVEFNRDIRPILADTCFACHGPDQNKRQADLRLDVEEHAVGNQKAIVPGKPDESEFIKRITADDADERMPPGSTGKTLLPRQLVLLRRWVEQGAQYQRHWSFMPPQRPEVPKVIGEGWLRNPIDRFVLSRLEQQGLAPSDDADKRTLLRRLYFDLIGLPPKPEEVDAFIADTSPAAFEKLVDALLASPHYGERMAVYWLDVVRYADTGGYHSDNHRDVAPYRDYVIGAFQQNKPFDQFTVEQLAGDLLPNATREQRIASGFNRLLQTTEEGGAQPKEYTAKYAADRVRNTSVAWLGLTMGCCECHNHKYDPLTARDFYSLQAFFADVAERAVGRQDQTPVAVPEQEQQLARIDQQLGPLRNDFHKSTPELDAEFAKWAAAGEAAGLPKDVAEMLKIEEPKRTAEQKEKLVKHFRSVTPLLTTLRNQIADLEQQREAVTKTIPVTLVSLAVAPRTVRLLPRGNWLDDSGEVLEPATPASLNPLGVKDRRATRLDLARWMTSPENPLVARVFVNRLWKLCFGQGLVKSVEDFGTQGEWPSHPELLDWLAVEFRDSGWNVKHLHKLLVMSHTYQQTSKIAAKLRDVDPGNRLLARQGRFRLDAEFVRDNALAVSGLLSRTVGGPSVKPYQPRGYWANLNFPTREWENDRGENQYRRGVYTYWCRTFPQPSLVAFDAPSREECVVDRTRSNTPLQALVLLNDPTYVEAARVLAGRMLREGGASERERLTFAFRQALNRSPQDEEVKLLTELVHKHRQETTNDKAAAEGLLKTGDAPLPDGIDHTELAAWTSAARAILNLHETITRN